MKTGQKIAAWTLVGVLLLQVFGMNFLYGLYTIDKPVFIELFCVNKEVPELQCDGSCMLSKMKDYGANDVEEHTFSNVFQFSLTFLEEPLDFTLGDITISKVSHIYYYQNFYESHHLKSRFKPPILA